MKPLIEENVLFKQILSETEHKFFIGREEEMHLFRRCLEASARSKRILNIHGTSGMGKSYLLDQYQRISAEFGASFLLINSRDFAHAPRHMLHRMLELLDGQPHEHFNSKDCIQHMNFLAEKQQIVLAIDTYEEMTNLDRWLQEDLISNLDQRILIIIAGRYPLQARWYSSPGWRKLIADVPLQEFTYDDTRRYLSIYNINDTAQINAVYNLSNGHPLTLSLTASMIKDNQSIEKNRLHQSNLLHSLIDRWLKEVTSEKLRQILENVALLRRFDQDILNHILKERISDDLFNQITRYSFVRLGRRGWMMHDLMREAISLQFRKRSPKRYNALNQSIAAYYFNQIENNDDDQDWLMSEFFYHLEDHMIRAIFYDSSSHHHFQLEHVSGSEAEEAKQYLKNFKHTSLYENATFTSQHDKDEAIKLVVSRECKRVESELLTRPSFIHSIHNQYILLKDQGKVCGMAIIIPIHEESIDYLESQPVSRVYLQNITPEQRKKHCTPADEPNGWYVRLIDVIDPQDAVARSVLLQELLLLLFKENMIIASSPLPFYQQLLAHLGFQQLAGGTHYDYGSDSPAHTHVLDLKSLGLKNYLEVLATNAGISLQLHNHYQFADLTERENEIANLIIQGTPNKTIAEKLYVSEVTIKKHLSNIFKKKHTKNRAQLVKSLMDELNS